MPRHDTEVVRLTGDRLECSCGHRHEVAEYAPSFMTMVGVLLLCECPTHDVALRVTNR